MLKNIIPNNSRVPLLILLATWVVFFSRTLFLKQLYFLDDLKIIYYPLEYVYAQFQSAWQLPQWSPLFGFGHPLLAWGQLGFFTPIHVLLRFLGLHPLILLQVSILSYFLLGLVGMYIFLKRRNLHPLAASLGAIVFTFSGFNVGHLNHVNFYVAVMVLPWLLIAIDAFLKKPTLRRTAIMALVAAVIPLSGQPQISLYVLIAAAVIGLAMAGGSLARHDPPRKASARRWVFRVLALTVLAGVLAVSLSSLAILPLREFLPLTLRGDDLPISELFEFSYPPQHAITLLLPNFYGDHSNYWGPKSFQELSAYVGIIPLLLIGPALLHWRRHRSERGAALFLIAIAFLFALGKFSPVYRFMIDQRIITGLTIPGRFIFFFDLGVAMLAAIGLNDLMTYRGKRHLTPIALLLSLIIITILLIPFAMSLTPNSQAWHSLFSLLDVSTVDWWLITLGLISFIALLLAPDHKRYPVIAAGALVVISAASFIFYSWAYNPLTPAQQPLSPSPFSTELSKYGEQAGVPARLFPSEHLIQTDSSRTPTEPISPLFTIHQPFTIEAETPDCFILPIHGNPPGTNTVLAEWRRHLADQPLASTDITISAIGQTISYTLCFPDADLQIDDTIYLTISSPELSALRLFTKPATDPAQQILFVRVAQPTAAELTRSRKPRQLITHTPNSQAFNAEADLLMRHLQVTADSSGSRWIGALALKQYRKFIEHFFANDREPFDGAGNHAALTNRHLLNFTGTTHLTQAASRGPDNSLPGFELIKQIDLGREVGQLYHNPDAFPKAWLASGYKFQPVAEEIYIDISQPDYDFTARLHLDGPTPPIDILPENQGPPTGTVNIVTYDPTQVDIKVSTPDPAILVLNDTWSPQWQVFVDGQPAPSYFAASLFRAAHVPAGDHLVSFRYLSPATERAKQLTGLALVVVLILLILPHLTRRQSV